jgi:hypothetical protein
MPRVHRFLVVLILILITHTTFSQRKNTVLILGKSKQAGVWLRWAPTDVSTWQLGNKYGYIVERFTLLPDGELEQGSQVLLTQTPLKPYTNEQFNILANLPDEVSAVQELLYSEDLNKSYSSDDIGAVLSKSKELENRFGFILLMCDLSQDAAVAAGLFLKDPSAQKGKRYIYRIKLGTTLPNIKIEPSTAVIAVVDEKPLQNIKDLQVTFGDKKATLRWSTILHKGIYSAYYIERTDDSKNFKKLSEVPYVHMTQKINSDEAFFVDSLDVNQKKYFYRISGISPFAETGPYSNIVSGEGIDNLNGFLIIREGKVLEQKKIRVAWEFPPEAEKQIAGFYVASSATPAGPYVDVNKKVLLKTVREFFNETPYYNTYYILRAVDKNGNEITRSYPYLVQVADETPPNIPSGLTGTMSKSGVASLKWNANTDKDLLGYRVFRSNTLHEEYVEVTKEILPNPIFIDSINLHALNKKIFYRVIAVDKNYNPSDYGNLLELKRPDIIAPTAPVFIKADFKQDTIELQWHNSVSDDVAKYELIRMEKEDKLNRVIKTWYPADSLTRFTDLSLTLGKTYMYKIIAYDSADNKNIGNSREIFFETGVRKPVAEIKATAEREMKQITISWKNESTAVKVFIYRKINDNTYSLDETLDGNAESFIDKSIRINNIYGYKIQAVYKGGIKSLLSSETKITY